LRSALGAGSLDGIALESEELGVVLGEVLGGVLESVVDGVLDIDGDGDVLCGVVLG